MSRSKKDCSGCIWHDTCPDNKVCCFYTPYDMEGTALAEYYDSCEERGIMGRITAEEQGNVEEW